MGTNHFMNQNLSQTKYGWWFASCSLCSSHYLAQNCQFVRFVVGSGAGGKVKGIAKMPCIHFTLTGCNRCKPFQRFPPPPPHLQGFQDIQRLFASEHCAGVKSEQKFPTSKWSHCLDSTLCGICLQKPFKAFFWSGFCKIFPHFHSAVSGSCSQQKRGR